MLHFVRRNHRQATQTGGRNKGAETMTTGKGTGSLTSTHHIDGALYQVRLLKCGKAEHCNTCKEDGGHLAVYLDTGAKGGARWKYVGKQLPQSDPDYTTPTCQREGCTNPTPRKGQKYCSATCRVAANRAKGQA